MLSPASLPAFLAFALLALVLPGVALQRLLRTPVEPALVLPLGFLWCAGSHWLALAADTPWLAPALLAACLFGGFVLARTPWRRTPGPSLRGALPPFLALVALLAFAQYRFNRPDAEGGFVLDPLVTADSAFHVGLARELTLGPHPQVPGVAGFPIGYHLGTDLIRAAALTWAGVDPWDSLTRLDVSLFGLALILGLRSLVARLGGSAGAISLVPWTLLLTDFSYFFATNPQAHWWTDLLRGNLLLSLCYANPILPALALLFGILLALARHLESGKAGALLLALLQAAALPHFKVFLGGQLLLGLGVAFVLAVPPARRALALVALPCALSTALLALGQGSQSVAVTLAPFDLARATRDTLSLPPLFGLAFAAWGALWLGASLGARWFGVPLALRSLRGSAPASVLAAMALSGWPLGLLFRISAPEVLEGQKFVNDAAYLLEQSGPLLWIFTALALLPAARGASEKTTGRAPRLSGWRTAALPAVVILVSLPATAHYAWKKARTPPDHLPPPMVRAVAALARSSQPGDVVLQRPGARYPPAPVILAGRRVPYERFTPYLTQFASRQALEARHQLVYRFFRTEDRAEAIAIARTLDARFVALYASDRLRFDATGLLDPIHEEEGARLFRLRLESAP